MCEGKSDFNGGPGIQEQHDTTSKSLQRQESRELRSVLVLGELFETEVQLEVYVHKTMRDEA